MATFIAFALPSFASSPFVGSWSLDAARSEGLPPDMQQEMTIADGPDGAIDVKTVISSEMGERTVEDRYIADDAEHEIKPVMPNFPDAKGSRTAKKSGVGRFLSTDRVHATSPSGAVEFTIVRDFAVAEDGKSLTILLSAEGPNGNVKSKRIFVRR